MKGSAVGQDLFDHLTAVNGGAFKTSIMEESQIDMIQTQEMKNSGMNIVNVASMLNGSQSYLVS